MDVFNLTDEELENRVDEVRQKLLETLFCYGQNEFIMMTAVADLLGLLIVMVTLDSPSGRPVIMKGFVTHLGNAIERYGKIDPYESMDPYEFMTRH